MTNPPSTDRRVRKTIQAVRRAIEALLQENRLEQITVKQIAEEADVGYTTFFRHFSSKEDAVADLVDHEATLLLRAAFPLLRSTSSLAACEALCNHVADHRSLWLALLAGGAGDQVRAALLDHTAEYSVQWPQAQSWLDDPEGAALVVGLVAETLGWWLTRAPQLDASRIAKIIDQLFVAKLVDAHADRQD